MTVLPSELMHTLAYKPVLDNTTEMCETAVRCKPVPVLLPCIVSDTVGGDLSSLIGCVGCTKALCVPKTKAVPLPLAGS